MSVYSVPRFHPSDRCAVSLFFSASSVVRLRSGRWEDAFKVRRRQLRRPTSSSTSSHCILALCSDPLFGIRRMVTCESLPRVNLGDTDGVNSPRRLFGDQHCLRGALPVAYSRKDAQQLPPWSASWYQDAVVEYAVARWCAVSSALDTSPCDAHVHSLIRLLVLPVSLHRELRSTKKLKFESG